MKMFNIPKADIRQIYVPFRGGIDLATPVLSLKPGNALEALNYEPGLMGGYRRIDGYERFDGRPAPSAATYDLLEGPVTGTIAVGDTVTGATSGSTGRVIQVDANRGYVCITKATGSGFVAGEQIKVGLATVATLVYPGARRGYRDAPSDAAALALAADAYRADIQKVPGAGPLRGVWMHKGVLYAFRDNVGATACIMHKATSTGWQAVALGEEIAFSNANEHVKEGAVLDQGAGAQTALIARVIVETGTLLSGTNTGRIILKNRTGTGFSAGEATTIGTGAGELTISDVQAPITLLPGGRFEFVSSNLGGASKTYRMYGCDGKNRAFEFDSAGDVFVPIKTGMEKDAPKFIVEHKKKLFLAFDAAIQFSGDGDPYKWTILTGAGEIGLGDDVTGFAVQAGETLAVFSRNSSHQLNGATTNSFQMNPISKEVGAIPYTVQVIGRTLALDDRGIVATDRTQAYGNFVQSTLSAMVQPLIDQLRAKAIGAAVYRARNQYRVYGLDGSGLILTMGESGPLGVTRLQYPVKPTCFASCEDGAGTDVVFFGADDGYVYQADRGSSFDGQVIEACLRMPFNNVGGPRVRKRFRRAVLEMTATGYAKVNFQPEFSYGDPDIAPHRLQSWDVTGGGGYWDASNWDEFFYDARLVSNPAFSIEGTGLNMSLMFYSASAVDAGHELQGMQIQFSPRRLER